ncbi:MAG: F0F1 ATP synthase subunit epsilon [Planctomycetaceae bacterium]|nr:F0F1 ATP synthase subunit epsilon [Planctomycetaceae bacterium]
MNLKILLPTKVLLSSPVKKVVAEGENGAFCLLPRHVDFVSALVPGILSYRDPQGEEHFAAVAEGILVKSGEEVRISTRSAVLGTDLGTLRKTVAEEFLVLDDRERTARTAVARLEADFVRRFLQFEEHRNV